MLQEPYNSPFPHIHCPAETLVCVCLSFPVVFDDCKGNNRLNFEVSNPDFQVKADGSLVAVKNVTEAGRAFFIHARSAQAEDMAEVLIVGGKEKHGYLKEIFKMEGNLGILRQKRSIVATPILIPENQRPPFPRPVGRVIDSDRPEGSRFRLYGKGVEQEPKGMLKINEITGEVMVTRPLDREAFATYQLQVETTDQSGKIIEGPVPLDIIVIDQNDNRPIFREGPYIGHVMEGSPTGRFASVMFLQPTVSSDLLSPSISCVGTSTATILLPSTA
uniref:Cadherin-13 n=1 Tax=Sphenodon punctatus TaxID=8508 RepID=A0A8D0GSV5_SPHPU